MKMEVQILAIITRDDSVLLRKKPDGSPPYKETWYSGFGAVLDTDHTDPENELIKAVKNKIGIDVTISKRLWWDTEVKPDHDGVETFYIWLHCLCEYASGDLRIADEWEKLEWIPKSDLSKYDIVPPARRLFKRLEYLA